VDIGTITTLIGNLGFPIVAIIACGWFVLNMVKAYRDDLNSQMKQMQSSYEAREEKMYLQLGRFNDTLDKFNETLIKIDKRLEVVESKFH
jgi:hypothetical protein